MSDLRAVLDRAAHLRDEHGIVDALRRAEDTGVIVVRDRRARVADGRLVEVPPAAVGQAEWALLGRRAGGRPILLAVVEPLTAAIDAAPDETWLGIRDTGGALEAEDTELLVSAIALAGWLREGRFCAACGAETVLEQAGWSRRCGSCGAQHFPRTDPAVIVAVSSPDGERLLLGANVQWRGRMHSCFAGFVEAGESLETTVHREIEEEAGVRLSDIRYAGSQAWPYPRSLMIGFHATATDERRARADGEEIVEVRWFTRDEIGAALAGRGTVGLPGPSSIARGLIEQWYEGQV